MSWLSMGFDRSLNCSIFTLISVCHTHRFYNMDQTRMISYLQTEGLERSHNRSPDALVTPEPSNRVSSQRYVVFQVLPMFQGPIFVPSLSCHFSDFQLALSGGIAS